MIKKNTLCVCFLFQKIETLHIKTVKTINPTLYSIISYFVSANTRNAEPVPPRILSGGTMAINS